MSKILLVEDNPMLIEVYRDLLEDVGLTLDIATDGEHGLKLIETGGYTLVYLDIMLPKLNGIHLLKKLKPEVKSQTKIIILTNLNQPHMIEDAKKQGAFDYKIKAYLTPEDFVQLTRYYLGM